MDGILFRRAVPADLPTIVRLLADDELGRRRERPEEPLPESYRKAFEEISADKNHELLVAEVNGHVIGTLQLTFIPSISFQGGLRAQVESVRIAREYQKKGIGSLFIQYVIQRARERGAHVLQLTTHTDRKDAHRFYEKLGFKSTHLGMKLNLK